MTPAKKWLTFGFIVILGLGGGAGGAYYYHTRELQAVRDRTTKDLLVSRARSLLLEAALATRYGNYAMAFERAIRAQAMAARIGLPMDKEFAELQQFLLQQRPDIELATRLVMLADRIEPPAPLARSHGVRAYGPTSLSVYAGRPNSVFSEKSFRSKRPRRSRAIS